MLMLTMGENSGFEQRIPLNGGEIQLGECKGGYT